MKTISVAVEESDYEAFQRASKQERRPIAQLIREAMGVYRVERLESRKALTTLPVLTGHRQLAPLPSRAELYDELFGGEGEP
jgi:hypothetical protein